MILLKQKKHALRHTVFELEKNSTIKGLGEHWGQCQKCPLNYCNAPKSPHYFLMDKHFVCAQEDRRCCVFPDGIPEAVFWGHQKSPFPVSKLVNVVKHIKEKVL